VFTFRYTISSISYSVAFFPSYICVHIQKFPDSLLGLRMARSTAFCHYVPWYWYLLSQSNEFCHHNLLHFFSKGIYFCCVLSVICDSLMADLKEQRTCIKFCLKLWKLHQKCMKCSKQLPVTVSCREHRLLNDFLHSVMRKLRLKIVRIQVIPPQFAQTQKWRKFAKSSKRTYEVQFRTLLAGYASHMEYASKF
jgi:hypothetical protein